MSGALHPQSVVSYRRIMTRDDYTFNPDHVNDLFATIAAQRAVIERYRQRWTDTVDGKWVHPSGELIEDITDEEKRVLL